MLVINEEQNYFRLKETIRAKDDLLSNIGQDRFEQSKSTGKNKRQNLKLKTDLLDRSIKSTETI